jgi:RNA polymerase sigma-70 factor (ECF subfamily)
MPSSFSQDLAVLARIAAQGDPRAFDRLTSLVYPRLHAFAHTVTSNPADASDLTQETLVRAYRYIGQLGESPKVWPWLKRVALNVHLDEQRRRNRRPVVSVEGITPDGEPDPEALYERPDANAPEGLSALVQAYEAEPVWRAMEWLTLRNPKMAETLYRHFFEGRRLEERDGNSATARSHKVRGLKYLREYLEAEAAGKPLPAPEPRRRRKERGTPCKSE